MEQWNDTRKDIKRMSDYEPEGCSIAEVNGKPVGHVFSVSYGRLGWIGLLIVKAEHRRKGIGTLLTKKVTSYLLSHGVETIRLEVVPTVSDLYRGLGFVDEYDSLRLMGINRTEASLPSSTVLTVGEEEMREIAKFDAKYFGANRMKVLSRLYQDRPELCFVSNMKSRISGYIMCRKTENGYRIGPWICSPDNPLTAKELLLRFMEAVKPHSKLYIGVPAINETAVRIVQDIGFKLYSKSIRMFLGKRFENERADGVFAIGGPEKG
jgi:hypothetical protein